MTNSPTKFTSRSSFSEGTRTALSAPGARRAAAAGALAAAGAGLATGTGAEDAAGPTAGATGATGEGESLPAGSGSPRGQRFDDNLAFVLHEDKHIFDGVDATVGLQRDIPTEKTGVGLEMLERRNRRRIGEDLARAQGPQIGQ